MHLTEPMVYASTAELEINEDETFTDYVNRVVESLGTTEALDVYAECNGTIHKMTNNSGVVAIVPPCAIVVERVLGDTTVVGFRCSALTPGKTACHNFRVYAKRHSKVHGDDNPSSKFWRTIGEFLGVAE